MLSEFTRKDSKSNGSLNVVRSEFYNEQIKKVLV